MTFHRASPSCHVTLSCIGACLAHRLAPSSLPVHRYITADGNSMRESGTPESESKVRRCISLSYLIASSGETCFLRLIEMAKPSVSSPPVSASSKDPRRESHDTTLPCDDGVASSLLVLFLYYYPSRPGLLLLPILASPAGTRPGNQPAAGREGSPQSNRTTDQALSLTLSSSVLLLSFSYYHLLLFYCLSSSHNYILLIIFYCVIYCRNLCIVSSQGEKKERANLIKVYRRKVPSC
ncbi:hypothetical protein H105_02497 [Trichophyton soudanense CBS 452.61]|uniref:Uncharacterized protein n=1 Tax=Trichophyton soudanense CBS 452.61 TaxID=1215331 RepID=A0A022XZ95_TRISD|nr:hypothetical protein H105_02497 [Trichophyton soudanense CBS 452.61]EZG08420.1 hypothetical protein H106_02349 [Trichophyton rubrum CBS 735.88]